MSIPCCRTFATGHSTECRHESKRATPPVARSGPRLAAENRSSNGMTSKSIQPYSPDRSAMAGVAHRGVCASHRRNVAHARAVRQSRPLQLSCRASTLSGCAGRSTADPWPRRREFAFRRGRKQLPASFRVPGLELAVRTKVLNDGVGNYDLLSRCADGIHDHAAFAPHSMQE